MINICPYCSNTHLHIQEDRSEGNKILHSSLCVLCGYSRTVSEIVPEELHLEKVLDWMECQWHSVVDDSGARLYEWDFEDKEAASAVAEALSGVLHTWSLKEDWDGLTLPNPYSAYLERMKER